MCGKDNLDTGKEAKMEKSVENMVPNRFHCGRAGEPTHQPSPSEIFTQGHSNTLRNPFTNIFLIPSVFLLYLQLLTVSINFYCQVDQFSTRCQHISYMMQQPPIKPHLLYSLSLSVDSHIIDLKDRD